MYKPLIYQWFIFFYTLTCYLNILCIFAYHLSAICPPLTSANETEVEHKYILK